MCNRSDYSGADLPPPGRRCDNVWKSNHKGFWRDAAHGELLGSTLGGWNTFDPQGASFLTRTLGKKDFDAGEGGFFAGSRARVQWTSTSFSFLREQVVGFATVPRFGDRDAVQLKMFGLVMADAAAPPRFFFFFQKRNVDGLHPCGILVIWHGPFLERTGDLTG